MPLPDRVLLARVLVGSTVLLALSPNLGGQGPSPQAGTTPGASQAQDVTPKDAVLAPIDDPYEAYEAGQYEQALAGLIDRQIERPEDPDLQLGVGSAQYQLQDFEAAEQSYTRAALSPDPIRRFEALYNLGNTAYRQGRLLEAIDGYVRALDLNPDDEDAKFNLEFVREEVRRRQEEAQQRPQNQQQDQQPEDQQGEGGEDQRQDGDDGSQGQPQDSDRDGDGLPDEVERLGQNPTDPANPDTDGDGKLDGEEDANRNGQVDPGESDPNVPEGDESSRGQAEEPREEQDGDQAEGPTPGRQMTEAEAERYLQSLEEERPADPKRAKSASRVRVEKDW